MMFDFIRNLLVKPKRPPSGFGVFEIIRSGEKADHYWHWGVEPNAAGGGKIVRTDIEPVMRADYRIVPIMVSPIYGPMCAVTAIHSHFGVMDSPEVCTHAGDAEGNWFEHAPMFHLHDATQDFVDIRAHHFTLRNSLEATATGLRMLDERPHMPTFSIPENSDQDELDVWLREHAPSHRYEDFGPFGVRLVMDRSNEAFAFKMRWV